MTPTSWQQSVIDQVRQIPAGTVRTYRQVASAAGSPRAARSVGSIMKNNQDITVPCHRVVRSDGQLGEYNGLQGTRFNLLRSEGISIINGRIQL